MTLTARQHDILERVAHDEKRAAIAADLGISRKTVDFHLMRIFRKARVHSAPAAVRFFLTNEVIQNKWGSR